jgi:C1A family cysteine protease
MARRFFYGALPDSYDARDYRYTHARVPEDLPAAVDLRPTCSPVRDQGDLSSCTGFAATVGLREQMLLKAGQPLTSLSPLFLYFEERALEGTIAQDAGAEPRDAMKVLAQLGCATEAADPYDISRFTAAPSPAALAGAASFRIAAYHRVHGLNDIRACLAGGTGVLLGIQVYESFENIGPDGKMPLPVRNEEFLGGHAVFCCGYQMDAQWPGGGYLIVKNSWGPAWGDKGYFYMPFAYVTARHVPDAWTAQ